MFNGNIINDLLKERGITKKEFIHSMGWSTFSQYRQFAKGNPTAKILERAADFFQVPIDTFFERHDPIIIPTGTFPQSSSAHTPSTTELLGIQVENLKKLLEEKDKRILLLEKMVTALESGQTRDQPFKE